MNAVAQDSAPSLDGALAAAYERRAEARAKVENAGAAFRRARQTDAEAQAELARRNSEHEEWVSRQSVKLDRWTEAGCHGPRPTLAADVKAVLALQSARDNADAAAASLKRFEVGERAARAELADAERLVEIAVDEFLAARAIKAAQRILQKRAEMIDLGRQELPNPLNIPLDKKREQPLIVQEAIALLVKVGPDDTNRPLHELGVPAVGIFRSDDMTYAERRSALIRGDLVAGEAERREEHQENAA